MAQKPDGKKRGLFFTLIVTAVSVVFGGTALCLCGPVVYAAALKTEVTLKSGEITVEEVTVRDTAAPVLTTVEGPVSVPVGETVKAEDLISSVEDSSGVVITFSNGKAEYTADAPGDEVLTVVAADEAGNRTVARVSVHFYIDDREAPVISGVADAVLQVGEPFDPLEGVSVQDNVTTDVSVVCEPAVVDTSQQGTLTLTYTACDEAGNRTEETCRVLVYERTAGTGDGRFGIFWDTAGKANQPYLVTVNRILNTVTVYGLDDDSQYTVPVKAFICSTGTATPLGTYTTTERLRWHELQQNCFGQYCIRITGHIMFHSVPYFTYGDPSTLEYEEYNKLGEAASLGCIRLTVEDEKWLYENCPDGFVTVIYDDEWTPGPLGKPEAAQIDVTNEELRGWDPTDPDPNNPWRTS